jgi:RNA polymerase sigma-70 factor (ECF subfamily)
MKATYLEDVIDCGLLAAVAKSDRTAFDHLYRRYETRVHGYVKSIVRDHHTAEDIVIATMTTVWQIAANYGAKSRVSTWILGIARHKAIDALRLRTHALPTAAVQPAAELGEFPVAAMDAVEAEQLSQSMCRAMSQLSTEHREALRLAYYEDLPYGEIAERLGIPANTVKSRVFYAKRELKRLLSAPLRSASVADKGGAVLTH